MRTVITSSDTASISFSELKRYGSLLKYLALRDVFVRYKQTWIGLGWSVVRPLINIVIFGLLSLLIDHRTGIRSRFIMVSAGVIFWQLISTATSEVSGSLGSNSNLLSKVYFPRLILPFSSLLVCLVDFCISLVIFLVAYLFIQGPPSWQIVLLPLVVVFGLFFSFSFGLIFATGSVKYRDVRFVLPFLLQVLFYASPVFISSAYFMSLNLPGWVNTLYQLNPLVFMINAFKYCLTGQFELFDVRFMLVAIAGTVILFFFSVYYFTRFEKSFADFI